MYVADDQIRLLLYIHLHHGPNPRLPHSGRQDDGRIILGQGSDRDGEFTAAQGVRLRI